MRKNLLATLSLLCAAFLCIGLSGCKKKQSDTENDNPPTSEQPTASVLINGGFESADLSGWTIEYGDAFDDDCVSSQKTFMYDFDANNNVLSINQTGNWYLTGKGYHSKYSGARTGAIRSTNASTNATTRR